MPERLPCVNRFHHSPVPTNPVPPTSRPFGVVVIGDTAVSLESSTRCPYGRGYFLDDDEPAIVFGPDPDPATIGNAVWAMVLLLGLRPEPANGQAVAHV